MELHLYTYCAELFRKKGIFYARKFEVIMYVMRMAKIFSDVMLCLSRRVLDTRFLIHFCEYLPVNTANINLRIHFTLWSLSYVTRSNGLRNGAVLTTKKNKLVSYGASPLAYRSQRSKRISDHNQHTFKNMLIKRPPVPAQSLGHHQKPLSSRSLLHQGLLKNISQLFKVKKSIQNTKAPKTC
jgi:hypothetical protein